MSSPHSAGETVVLPLHLQDEPGVMLTGTIHRVHAPSSTAWMFVRGEERLVKFAELDRMAGNGD